MPVTHKISDEFCEAARRRIADAERELGRPATEEELIVALSSVVRDHLGFPSRTKDLN